MALVDRFADTTLVDWGSLPCLYALCQARAPSGFLGLRRMPLVTCAALLQGADSSRQDAVNALEATLMSWNGQYSQRDRSDTIRELIQELRNAVEGDEKDWTSASQWALATLRSFSASFHAEPASFPSGGRPEKVLNCKPPATSVGGATTFESTPPTEEATPPTEAEDMIEIQERAQRSGSAAAQEATPPTEAEDCMEAENRRSLGIRTVSKEPDKEEYVKCESTDSALRLRVASPVRAKRQLTLDSFQGSKRLQTANDGCKSNQFRQRPRSLWETLSRSVVSPKSKMQSTQPMPATLVDSSSQSDTMSPNMQKGQHAADTGRNSCGSDLHKDKPEHATRSTVTDHTKSPEPGTPQTPVATERLCSEDATPAACDKPCKANSQDTSQETRTSAEMKTPQEPHCVDIKVVAEGSNGMFEMIVTIPEDRPFSMLMDAFCEYQELNRDMCRFVIHGTNTEISVNDTPVLLGWDANFHKIQAVPSSKFLEDVQSGPQ
eukprot:gnl/MRDRNA2_/MRDRNA2_112393_c0_seq1.p1 gnl/MRDRNA2_/MRDRNA2_112393_c0~~gnl/MRDRNA2_/MRDRNA2_112393_c0_seq1.p1  ORF type:complete len:493 (+),score=89.45 gnl/MRDRNA2_/MRDRNA2_112393_c0_seq1:2-1480(+)